MTLHNGRIRQTTALLTADEERQLAQQIEAGAEASTRVEQGNSLPGDIDLVTAGKAARARFIEANMRLVLSIASKAGAPAHVDRQDIVQDGMVGLDRAVTKFDWRRGYKFSTYATWWIRQSIQRGLEHNATTVRIPAHRSSELRNAQRAGLGITELPPILSHVASMSRLESLDRPVGDGEDPLAIVVPSNDPSPEEQIEHRALREDLREALQILDDSTRHAVIRRFGLDGSEPATYGTIAADLGITQEAVRRRVIRALARLGPELQAAA